MAENEFDDINKQSSVGGGGREFARSRSLAGTSTIDFKQPQSIGHATDLVSNVERISLKKPKDKYMAQLGEPKLIKGATIKEMDFSEDDQIIERSDRLDGEHHQRSQSLATGYTISDLKPQTSSGDKDATELTSNLEGMSLKKKKSSAQMVSGVVNNLWPQFDFENTGFLDKIEAQNFTNEVLIMMGKGKMQSAFQFN